MLVLHFHATNTFIGKAIRFITRGSVNHVSVEIQNTIFEADMKKGVICHKVKKNIVESITFDVGNDKEVYKWLKQQVGKKYDWLGVFSFLWILLPDRIGSWYCSEVSTVAMMKYLGITEYNQKQSPQDLLLLAKIIKRYE